MDPTGKFVGDECTVADQFVALEDVSGTKEFHDVVEYVIVDGVHSLDDCDVQLEQEEVEEDGENSEKNIKCTIHSV